jgi:homogentisate phytyltransferase / homogentisate geranylgeranyltransferase
MACVQSLTRVRPTAVMGFSRPHTVIGTTVSITALYVLAWVLPVDAAPSLASLLSALGAGLAVNIYIVGLNQLTDVELDRINKPWLPLPARTLSVAQARWIVAGSAVLALGAAALGSVWLLVAIVLGIGLGTAYSVPPVRAKRYHIAAAACIVTVRGPVVNILVFAHFAGATLPAAILALTVMVTVLALAIAWFKDLPDMEGDRQFTVGTLPLRIGAHRVVSIGTAALLAAYLGIAAAGLVGIPGLHGGLVAGSHVGLGVFLVAGTKRLDLAQAESVSTFYRGIWGMFYAEYLVFTAAALLSS